MQFLEADFYALAIFHFQSKKVLKMEAYNGNSLKKENKSEEQEASEENAGHWQRHQKSTTRWSCNKTNWYLIEIDRDRNVIVKPQTSVLRSEV